MWYPEGMSTHCNICKGEVLLGEGGVTGIEHEGGCPHLLEVDWVPNVPGAGHLTSERGTLAPVEEVDDDAEPV